MAGQAIVITTDAKPELDPFEAGYADLVITLYDANQNQIAENDDPVPRATQDSQLFTVLPATDTYYLRVSEFCLSWNPETTANCPAYTSLTNGSYTIAVQALDPMTNSLIEETEPNDGAATASTWEFEENMTAGQYFPSIAWGDFAAADGVDFYSFTPPANVALDSVAFGGYVGRFVADFWFYPSGSGASGSLDDVGIVQLVDAATMEVVAELDANLAMEAPDLTEGNIYAARLSTPLLADGAKEYYLVVNKQGAQSGAGYFYFVWGGIGPSSPVEGDVDTDPLGDGNDTPAVADSLLGQGDAADGFLYFVDGNLDTPGDVDFYAVPNTAPAVLTSCKGASIGSGASLKLSLVEADGSLIAGGATKTESVAGGSDIPPVATPAGGGAFFLKVEKVLQDPDVLSDHYSCVVVVGDL
jgi:hypothetical protein